MKAIGSIMVFPNLNVCAFDHAGNQIPELQKSVATLLAEQMEKHGYDPVGVLIETPFSNWRLFRMEDGGWNRNRV